MAVTVGNMQGEADVVIRFKDGREVVVGTVELDTPITYTPAEER